MISILFFVVLLGISLLLTVSKDYDTRDTGLILSWFWGAVLVCFLLAIPISHYNFKLKITEFEAKKETVYQQRDHDQTDYEGAYERATLTNSIVNENGWLAKQQRVQQLLWFNWYIPKSILEVEPIR